MPFAADRYRAINVATSALRLIALDDVWTPLADGGKAEDIESALMVASDMLLLLGALQADLEFVAQAASKVTAEQFSKAIAAGKIKSAPNLTLDYFKKKARTLPKIAAAEREELVDKMKQLQSGRTVAGDMSRRFKCGSSAAVMLMAAWVQAWPVAAAGFVGVFTYCD